MSSVEPVTLCLADGSRLPNPGPADLERAVRDLSGDRYFAIVDRGAGHYVQVAFVEGRRKRPAWYALERREGSAERHYQCAVTEVDEVVEAFTAYASGQPGWEERFGWQRI